MKSEYPLGTRVRFKPEWADGDGDLVFVVVGEDEGKGRVDVSPEVSDLPYPGIETVRTTMIEKVDSPAS